MSKQTYIDVHVLQTVPPSNVNRDDAGSPKQAIYGGVRRARVSSQAWKRATRKEFAQATPEAEQATRTARISTVLANRLDERTELDSEQATRLATALLKPVGVTASSKKESNTAYLLFFGRAQIDGIVDLVADRAIELATLDDEALEAEMKQLPVSAELQSGHPIDVALFGRMVADIPALNVDAATQVAHAISTHPVEIEFDYFTAVDDEKERSKELEDAGAGMIGTVEFNSATLYRYATVGLHQLVDNLGGSGSDAVDAVERFIDGFVRSMPTGHQNTFAHRTLPSAVVVVVRDDQPVNLVSAFEEPVRSRDGQAAESAKRLASELLSTQERWAQEPLLITATYEAGSSAGTPADLLNEAFGASQSFPQLLAAVRACAEQRVAAGEA